MRVLFKGTARVHEGDLGGLRALQLDQRVRRPLVVCLEKEPRVLDSKIEIVPWRLFLERLWGGDLA